MGKKNLCRLGRNLLWVVWTSVVSPALIGKWFPRWIFNFGNSLVNFNLPMKLHFSLKEYFDDFFHRFQNILLHTLKNQSAVGLKSFSPSVQAFVTGSKLNETDVGF